MYVTDKSRDDRGYVKYYSHIFGDESFRRQGLNITEIGVQGGESVRMWHEYFSNSNIYGIDVQLQPTMKWELDFDKKRNLYPRLHLLELDIKDDTTLSEK